MLERPPLFECKLRRKSPVRWFVCVVEDLVSGGFDGGSGCGSGECPQPDGHEPPGSGDHRRVSPALVCVPLPASAQTSFGPPALPVCRSVSAESKPHTLHRSASAFVMNTVYKSSSSFCAASVSVGRGGGELLGAVTFGRSAECSASELQPPVTGTSLVVPCCW